MIRELQLRVLPQDAAGEQALKQVVSQETGVSVGEINAVRILKRSIDARQRTIFVNLKVQVFIQEDLTTPAYQSVTYGDVSSGKPVVIVGAGPGGLFAALRAIELGLRPIVVERGKNVRERKKDIARISREHLVNPESNYSFGEGGAGAYSDGKLYTRSKKRGSVEKILNVFCLAMAGYVFAKKRFRFKNTIYAILSLSMVIPTTALMSPVYNIITKLGLYDTKFALILVYTALNMPISLMVLRSAFASIPTELEEAAYIDGAGFFRTFIQVMMPCAKGGLASAAVLTFLESWNEFTFALLLTSSTDNRTLPLSLSYFTSQFSFNYTAMFAAITIAVLPSIIVFAIFQEQVNASLTAGSVKG